MSCEAPQAQDWDPAASCPWETSMDQKSAPRFMTVAEVADLMRVSKMTVYRLIHSGEMPAIRVGKSFRVPESAVRQLIAAGLSEWSDERAGGIGG